MEVAVGVGLEGGEAGHVEHGSETLAADRGPAGAAGIGGGSVAELAKIGPVGSGAVDGLPAVGCAVPHRRDTVLGGVVGGVSRLPEVPVVVGSVVPAPDQFLHFVAETQPERRRGSVEQLHDLQTRITPSSAGSGAQSTALSGRGDLGGNTGRERPKFGQARSKACSINICLCTQRSEASEAVRQKVAAAVIARTWL